jgi:hypothetical protein
MDKYSDQSFMITFSEEFKIAAIYGLLKKSTKRT